MGDLIVPIADHPTGLWMRKTVDDCFASEVISPRTKLFMMGIVAKGLNCGYSAAASFRELGEKAPSRAEFNDILDSFGVGILPEEDQALLRWIRKTIRYLPIAVQRDTEELMGLIGPDKTVEAIGTAATINMMVRMAMLSQ